MPIITDESSLYTNISSASGAVYSITGSISNQAIITITACKFINNYGGTGGVFNLIDYFSLTISKSFFQYNNATKGGVMYI